MAFPIFNSQFSIVSHRLVGDGVTHLVCAKNTRKLIDPDMIVLHYTAGVSAASSAVFLTRPDVGASAHVVIGRDGEVFQLVPFNIEAWHAGKSWYAGRNGLNRYSIGIELDNLGKLRLSGGMFIAECGRMVPPEECTRIVRERHRLTGTITPCGKCECYGKSVLCWRRLTRSRTWWGTRRSPRENLTRDRHWNSRLTNSKLKTKS